MSNLGNKSVMSKNIQHYMTKYHKSRNDLCDALGVKYTTLTDWINGNTYPRIDKIELMANYFNIKKSDLIEDHSDIEEIILSDSEKILIERYRILDSPDRGRLDAYLEGLCEKYKKDIPHEAM